MLYFLAMSQILVVYLTLLSSCVRATELKIPRLRSIGKAFYADTQNSLVTSNISKDYQTFFFNQTLDHFNYKLESYTTFKQKYVINFKNWGGASSKAPIFAYLGAEGPIDSDITAIGFLPENAQRFKALLIYMEHRFYGESIPFNLNLQEILQNNTFRGYFSSAQALADYAAILIHIKNELRAHDSPIVVIGASYGGMLASWFRLKYPHVAIGALASSAPILYFDDITPQDGYYSIVTKDFRDASEECYEMIKESWSEIDKLALAPNGFSQLSQIFKTCEPLTNSSILKDYLFLTYAHAAQYNAPPSYPVITICNAINNGLVSSKSGILKKIFDGMVAAKGNLSCYVNQPTTPTQTNLGWTWQTCTEMVFPMGVTRNDSMFQLQPFNLTSYIEYCKTQYGVAPRPHWITTYYGGHNIRRVLKRFGSNIIFSNGFSDPYSSGGVVESISDSILAVTTANGSHCLDILYSKPSDPDWLVMQRKIELQIIEGWIEKYYADLQV